MQIYSIIAIPIIILIYKFNMDMLTNKGNKYTHYLIYPVHFVIIYLIKNLI